MSHLPTPCDKNGRNMPIGSIVEVEDGRQGQLVGVWEDERQLDALALVVIIDGERVPFYAGPHPTHPGTDELEVIRQGPAK